MLNAIADEHLFLSRYQASVDLWTSQQRSRMKRHSAPSARAARFEARVSPDRRLQGLPPAAPMPGGGAPQSVSWCLKWMWNKRKTESLHESGVCLLWGSCVLAESQPAGLSAFSTFSPPGGGPKPN